jgi:hypothetical protein
MGLTRPVIWLLVVVWLAAFGCFAVVSQIAFASGTTFEYTWYGVQFPYVAFVLLTLMASSSGLLYANYRGEDFTGAEQLIYGALFGVSAFCLMLDAVVVLSLVLLA